ncbi:uncharacterized protein [Branchiostoma lanceolatum]|uniref:uncharacterized protein isoform X2 n=1 Tax=Branchiostoma lanceolatum TaxID=7740 RepID=UPI0034564F74
MPTTCVAGYCSNQASDSISLHKFPIDEKVREEWARNVRRTRGPRPGEKKWTPTTSSVLCSAHFTEECYDPVPGIMQALGCEVQHIRELLTGAVPTIFHRGSAPAAPAKRRKSRAAEKRLHQQTVAECLSMETVVEGRSDVSSPGVELEKDSALLTDSEPPVEVPPTESTDCGIQVKPDTKVHAVQVNLRAKRAVKSVQAQIKPPTKTVSTQNTPSQVTVATQTEITYSNWNETSDTASQMSVSVGDRMSMSDPVYDPSYDSGPDEDDHAEEVPVEEETSDSLPDTRIFLVFWTSLVHLFSVLCSCPLCPCRKLIWLCKEVGTYLKVTFKCEDCSYRWTWRSQPSFGRTAAGNILLSSSILFSGASVTKVLRVLSHMGVAVISARSFFRHQEQVLFKAVHTLWNQRQFWMLTVLEAEGEPLVCGGDGRADSPGHSAKYGTYTFMELTKTAVIDVQLVQSNEVGGSYHMEEEGLRRSLLKVGQHAQVGTLVTDRHVGINKMVREEHPLITHLFDIWHVAKSIKKKLQTLSKRRGCQELKPWVRSIINHLYWAVISTPAGSGDVIVAKWKSVLEHIHNRHGGFGGLFPACTHGPLEGREARKPWLTFHTKVSVEVEKILMRKKLLNDLRRLSPAYQTSYLEAFHSLILHFAPKMYHFSYQGMKCRVTLAALHFNENAHRVQARKSDGTSMFSVHFPKYKHGGHISMSWSSWPSSNVHAAVRTMLVMSWKWLVMKHPSHSHLVLVVTDQTRRRQSENMYAGSLPTCSSFSKSV